MAERLSFFLDANVLFSAAYSQDGRAAILFALARSGSIRLVSSRYAAEEARRNLSAKRPVALKRFSDNLALVVLVPEGDAGHRSEALATGLDGGDVPILAAAVGRAEALVTGDRRHFGRFMGKKLLGVRILSLADALARC